MWSGQSEQLLCFRDHFLVNVFFTAPLNLRAADQDILRNNGKYCAGRQNSCFIEAGSEDFSQLFRIRDVSVIHASFRCIKFQYIEYIRILSAVHQFDSPYAFGANFDTHGFSV